MANQHADNRGPQLLAVNSLFIGLALIGMGLRCYVRFGIVKAFGADDWLMLAGTIAFLLYCSCSTTGIHYGTGQHHADLEPENVSQAMEYWWFCYLFYATTMILCKMSIGWFLLRITGRRLHSWIIYCSVAITVVAGIVFFFVTLFQCKPISYFWEKNRPEKEGTCINADVVIGLAFLYSVFSVITDFVLALLPIFLISKLQMERKAKFVLAPLLVMGCIASSAVVCRFPYLHLLKDDDFLYATVDIAIWSTVEQGLAITAGSLATVRPLVKKLGLRLRFTRGESGATPSGNRIGSKLAGYARGGRSRGTSTGDFDMSRFRQQAEAISEGDAESGRKTEVGFDSQPRGKYCHFWKTTTTARRENTSEESLHRDASKEMPGDAETVSPKSFLTYTNK